jgi:hypothetical protein
MEQNPTDDELRSYLLGELQERQAAELEERILNDDELFDLVEALEAELLAAASRGELAPAERERVLRRLASSPEGRERLALARSLNTLADGAAETRTPVAPVVPFRPRVAGSKPVAHWVALAAAGLIAAAGLFWLTQQTPPGGDSAPRIAHERPAPANPVQPVPREEPAPPVATAPAAPEPSPAPDRLAGKTEAAVQRPEPVKAVFQLALTSLRGAEETETFRLPSNAEVAEIQIDLEGLDDSGVFHAVLRGKDQGTVWEKSGLKAQKLDWGTVLVLDVPVERLTAGLYEVAVTAGSEPEMSQELEIVREDR